MVASLETTSKLELAKFHHQSLGSPPTSAIFRALSKHPDELTSFELINKFLPASTATAKGHMTRTRKGLRSTQDNKDDINDARAQVDDMAPTEQLCTAIDDEIFCYSITTDNVGNVIYSDLPGQFPIELYSGMNYFFVA